MVPVMQEFKFVHKGFEGLCLTQKFFTCGSRFLGSRGISLHHRRNLLNSLSNLLGGTGLLSSPCESACAPEDT